MQVGMNANKREDLLAREDGSVFPELRSLVYWTGVDILDDLKEKGCKGVKFVYSMSAAGCILRLIV